MVNPLVRKYASADLRMQTIPKGSIYGRLYNARYPDPLGFGKSDSRFSDPRKLPDNDRFGVLYAGTTFDVCVAETIVRDDKDGNTGYLLVPYSKIENSSFAEVETAEALNLIDLSGINRMAMGIPSSVLHQKKQTTARRYSEAFYLHPTNVDGILYPSRLAGHLNIAVYDRAVSKLVCNGITPMKDHAEFPDAVTGFNLAFAK